MLTHCGFKRIGDHSITFRIHVKLLLHLLLRNYPGFDIRLQHMQRALQCAKENRSQLRRPETCVPAKLSAVAFFIHGSIGARGGSHFVAVSRDGGYRC